MNLNEYFNFNDIKKSDEITTYFNTTTFLATLSKTTKYNEGNLDIFGDILFGIKNNEPFDLKFILYQYENHELESIIIKSGEIGLLNYAPLLVLLNKKGKFLYKIESLNPSYNYISEIFFIKPFMQVYNIDFLCGYLTPELRNELFNKQYYQIINDKNLSLYINGSIITWLYTLCELYPQTVNPEFETNYRNHKYPEDIVFSKFKEMNKNWNEITYTKPY